VRLPEDDVAPLGNLETYGFQFHGDSSRIVCFSM
jgi:hypothetical protein